MPPIVDGHAHLHRSRVGIDGVADVIDASLEVLLRPRCGLHADVLAGVNQRQILLVDIGGHPQLGQIRHDVQALRRIAADDLSQRHIPFHHGAADRRGQIELRTHVQRIQRSIELRLRHAEREQAFARAPQIGLGFHVLVLGLLHVLARHGLGGPELLRQLVAPLRQDEIGAGLDEFRRGGAQVRAVDDRQHLPGFDVLAEAGADVDDAPHQRR